jgi:peptidoglycan hydrolase CwlO-like protein
MKRGVKMKKKYCLSLVVFAIVASALSYHFTMKDDDIETAYLNAKKGVLWGLSNIRNKKSKLDNKLVSNDKLIADVKVEKVVNGVRVIVTGYSETTDVTITTYRSFETLVKDGYLDKSYVPAKDEE